MRRFRCYDNADTPNATTDHYTIVTTAKPFYSFSSSSNPNHLQGVWSAEETKHPVDHNEPQRFGKRIPFKSLPKRVKSTVLSYLDN